MRPDTSPPYVQLAWRTFKCKLCGVEFKASRIDAEFCGATCRQRDRRIRLKVSQMIPGAEKSDSMEVPSRVTDRRAVSAEASRPGRADPAAELRERDLAAEQIAASKKTARKGQTKKPPTKPPANRKRK